MIGIISLLLLSSLQFCCIIVIKIPSLHPHNLLNPGLEPQKHIVHLHHHHHQQISNHNLLKYRCRILGDNRLNHNTDNLHHNILLLPQAPLDFLCIVMVHNLISKHNLNTITRGILKESPQEFLKIFPKELLKIFLKEFPKIFLKEFPKVFPKESPKIFPKESPKTSLANRLLNVEFIPMLVWVALEVLLLIH